MNAIEAAFWVGVALVAWAFAGYPAVAIGAGLIRRQQPGPTQPAVAPRVALFVAAYNEAASIARQLDNILLFDYPREQLRIVVVSDASSDETDAIVGGYASRGIELMRVEGRVGKSAAMNAAIAADDAEIVAVADATGIWNRSALRAMVRHFSDPRVGCVYGRVVYSYDGGVASAGFGLYQRAATLLRRAEAIWRSGVNAPGSIHCLRRSTFAPCPPETFSDMADPFHAARQGLGSVLEEGAQSLESARSSLREEWRARRRIALGAWGFTAYAVPRLPLVAAPAYCYQFLCHKLLRWLAGPLAPVLVTLNIALLSRGGVYRWALVAQIAGWTALAWAWGIAALGRGGRVVGVLTFLAMSCSAYALELPRYVVGTRATRWTPER